MPNKYLGILLLGLFACGEPQTSVPSGLVADGEDKRYFMWSYQADVVAQPTSSLDQEFKAPNGYAVKMSNPRASDVVGKKIPEKVNTIGTGPVYDVSVNTFVRDMWQTLWFQDKSDWGVDLDMLKNVQQYGQKVLVKRPDPITKEEKDVSFIRDLRFSEENPGHCYYGAEVDENFTTIFSYKNEEKPVDITEDTGLRALCGDENNPPLSPINEFFIPRRPVIDGINEELGIADNKRIYSSVSTFIPAVACTFLAYSVGWELGSVPFLFCQSSAGTVIVGYYWVRNTVKNWSFPSQGKELRSPNSPLYENEIDAKLVSGKTSDKVIKMGMDVVKDVSRIDGFHSIDRRKLDYLSFVRCPSAGQLPECKKYRKALISKLNLGDK